MRNAIYVSSKEDDADHSINNWQSTLHIIKDHTYYVGYVWCGCFMCMKQELAKNREEVFL